jgi:hypothetical protein
MQAFDDCDLDTSIKFINKAYWDETTIEAAIHMVDPAIVVQADEDEA